MRFLKRIAGILGFSGKEESHQVKDEDEVEVVEDIEPPHHHFHPQFIPRKGFSVPVQVAVDRAPVGPLLLPTHSGDGGVQGFRWYAKRLRIDEEGDVADEFWDEVLPEMKALSMSEDSGQQRTLPRFEVKYSTLPAEVKNQKVTPDGKLQQSVEHQGRLQWI